MIQLSAIVVELTLRAGSLDLTQDLSTSGQTGEGVGGATPPVPPLKINSFTKRGSSGESPFHQLIGRSLDDLQTLGKELFMHFGDFCLRIHFLMSGQSFNNNQQVDSETGGKTETPTLELLMYGDLLTFRNSAAEIRPSVTCLMKYEELNNLDICSPVFNFKRAYSLFREQHNRLVCDVLLDQFILPGVRNIIKNERG
ncbi:endonuclease 8-like 3 [Dreissena polymorpha]|uniref:endonuclease 8-like 3 n=1 Tax=Dreissena polymorpha TaxID=45954 RepID=UPI002264FA70|nr:endonuclease 8-like 3 [Dreissena polymorpha]